IYAAMTFILVHALYKATLFLTAGIIDHAVHTRDIGQLWGLGKYMPIVAAASFVAAFSSAGVPLFFGFLSKDLIYESTLHFLQWGCYLTALAVLTNVLLACSGFLAGVKPFLGKLSNTPPNLHKPSFWMWLPVVILSLFTLLFGVFPFMADDGLLKYAFEAVAGTKTELYLKLWHGFNTVLMLSLLTIFLGLRSEERRVVKE